MTGSYQDIKDLPEDEQSPFRDWLRGQTCPLDDDRPESELYYPSDYLRWRTKLESGFELFD